MPPDVSLEAGLAQAKQVMAPGVEALCRTDIGGDAQQVDSVETTYSRVTYQLVLFPAWIASYRYGDKTWQVLVNGCTGAVHGNRPYSALKILVAVAVGLAVSRRGRRTVPAQRIRPVARGFGGRHRGRGSHRRLAAGEGAGLLLLDEPTASLDLHHQEAVLRVARQRARCFTVELLSRVWQHPVEVVAHPRTGAPLVLPVRDSGQGLQLR